MAGEYLPPVVTELIADIDDVIAKVEEAKAAIKSLGDTTVSINFDVNQASLAQAKATAQALAQIGITVPVRFDVSNASAANIVATGAAVSSLSRRLTNLTEKSVFATMALAALDAELERKQEDMTATALGAGALNIAVAALAAATARAGQQTQASSRGWTIWGTNAATAIHWIVSGTMELLAVLVPATVAAAAWAFVWLQGATNVYQHLNALFDATESLGQATGHTYGEVLGLKGAFQAAQNAANPDVYQALGGALNVLKEQFGNLAGVGLAVGKIFDAFMARLVYDFSSAGGAGKTLNSVLSNMVPDLTHLGELFGNFGKFIADVAAQMPGLAEVLLYLISRFVGLADAIVEFVGKAHLGSWTLLTLAMAAEEFFRWGGLLVNIFNKLGLTSVEMGEKFLSTQRFTAVFMGLFSAIPNLLAAATMGFGNLLRAVSPTGSAIDRLGVNIGGLGSDLEESVAEIPVWQAALATVAAAGIGFLVYKLVTAQDAVQQFDASLQKNISNAGNLTVLNDITAGIGTLEQKLQQLPKLVEDGRLGFVNNPEIGQMASEISNLNSQFVGVIAHANEVGRAFGTTMVGGMALAQAAGVNLDKTLTGPQWAVAYLQIKDYVTGMKAMGSTTGQVGADMNALAVEEGLTGSKLQQVNQAWDQFMQNLVGGTSGLADAITSLSNIGSVTATVKNNLGEASSISLTVEQFAKALNHAGTVGAAAWTNFDQVLGSTFPQLADWLRTAQTEGALTGTSFSHDILDMAASLVPFAEKSKTAQAEVMAFANESGDSGLTFKQLVEDYKSGKYNLDALTGSVDQATQKMANMNQVAQQLGNVVQNDFIAEVGQAIIKSRTMTGAIQQWISAVEAGSPKAAADFNNIREMLEKAGVQGSELKTVLQGLQQYINTMHGKTIDIGVEISGAGAAIAGSGRGSTGGVGHPVPMASGGTARPGWAMVGERGPELMWMRGGETVVPNHKLNGYADGTGDVVVHSHVYLDGRHIETAVSKATFNKNFRNGSRMSGGRPTGNLRPR